MHQLCKLEQLRRRTFERFVGIRVANHIKQRFAQGSRNLGSLCNGLVPDGALRLVDNPAQAHFICGVVDDAQVGDHVADLLALIEAQAADNPIRHAGLHEHLFQNVRLRIHAVEHGKIGIFPAGGYLLQNLLGNIIRLILFVVSRVYRDLCARRVLRPEGLPLALRIVGDHRVCRVQDILRGAVVLFETDHRRAREALLKAHDVFNRRPAEFIDALVIVAHHAEVLPLLRQELHKHILRVVGVLVLIHHHIAELVLVIFQHIRAFLKQPHGIADQVVKIHGVRLFEALLVQLICLCQQDQPVVLARLLFVFLWRN